MVIKQRNRPEQRLARLLAASEGIKYTEALRRVRAFQAAANEKKEETTDDEFGDVMPQAAKDLPSLIVES